MDFMDLKLNIFTAAFLKNPFPGIKEHKKKRYRLFFNLMRRFLELKALDKSY